MGVLVVVALACIGVAAVAVAIGIGHRLVRKRDSIESSWQTVGAHLSRRHELISALVHVAGRRPVFDPVVRAQVAAEFAVGPSARAEAEEQLTVELDRALGVIERDPRLNSNRRYRHLRGQLTDTENRIAYARQYFNDAVRSYNRLVTTMPASVAARAFGHNAREPFAAATSSSISGRAQLHS
ncbi:LemA family protein [Antrihabitans sp. YC2-6]|uniref:LemA family protein n=1 Tax=Antrihabitans sp. YC2-6 TaxID=2799498 RepID=UPI0018F2F32D|nr:LemA family protein [Antrihabitans sp. YC2-6]MBJ8345836.1 LemA family protein [Antrihabitans sp. YC2-6]